jgi:Domain of unknown function (DUF222)
LSPLAAPRPATDVEVDLRSAAQRDADALVELAQRALISGDLPTEGGERPQVVVTVSLSVLQGLIGSATLTLGGPINAEIARRVACDAELIPVVLGTRGEPLDVGRASRTVPAAIRRAWCCATVDVVFRAVPSRPGGAKSITFFIGPTGARPASAIAWRSAAATTDSSTIRAGGSIWPMAFRNSIRHPGSADLHAAIPSTPHRTSSESLSNQAPVRCARL